MFVMNSSTSTFLQKSASLTGSQIRFADHPHHHHHPVTLIMVIVIDLAELDEVGPLVNLCINIPILVIVIIMVFVIPTIMIIIMMITWQNWRKENLPVASSSTSPAYHYFNIPTVVMITIMMLIG